MAERWAVRGFPTLKLVRHGAVFDYEGRRSANDLAAFAGLQLPFCYLRMVLLFRLPG